MNNLAAALGDQGRYDEAEKLFRQTLEIRRRVLGPEHPDTAASSFNLACMAARKGQRDEALSLLREAMEHGLKMHGLARLEDDRDLKSLHGDPRFQALVADARKYAAAGNGK
jgi:Tfp pilus assembly protein PilF